MNEYQAMLYDKRQARACARRRTKRVSSKSAIEGRHYDVIIMDDPYDDNEPPDPEQVMRWFMEELPSRMRSKEVPIATYRLPVDFDK